MFITLWILIFFNDGQDINLASFHEQAQCEEIRSHATSHKDSLVCIGELIREGESAHAFHMKHWT
jgi:hypothetical protein